MFIIFSNEVYLNMTGSVPCFKYATFLTFFIKQHGLEGITSKKSILSVLIYQSKLQFTCYSRIQAMDRKPK